MQLKTHLHISSQLGHSGCATRSRSNGDYAAPPSAAGFCVPTSLRLVLFWICRLAAWLC